jgi:hypothetical protein
MKRVRVNALHKDIRARKARTENTTKQKTVRGEVSDRDDDDRERTPGGVTTDVEAGTPLWRSLDRRCVVAAVVLLSARQ